MRAAGRLAFVLMLGVLLPNVSPGGDPLPLRLDFSRTSGEVRPLHGINKGPLAAGGMLDLTARLKEISPPWTRLHDCQWPYPEVVDMHAIFRVAGADPGRPESYDWALTDAYLEALRGVGAGIVYRLGESIEHGPVKRFVHPPADMQNWAAACVGVVRHYNEGWAGGTNHNIRYWEIWNEPENRPQMWSGTDADYIRLYLATAFALKKHDPTLKVGGPAVGAPGHFQEGRFTPSVFVRAFLDSCRRQSAPLDFFSWHCYTADPGELVARARAIRQVLNEYGFRQTESHLNEWNYLPDNSWDSFSKDAKPETRRKFYDEMSGARGAAFVTSALIELQDAPVDMCNFYHAEPGGFGLFNEFGEPNRVFYALRAFAKLAAFSARATSAGGISGRLAVLGASAGGDAAQNAGILVSNLRTDSAEFSLEIQGLARPAEYKYKIWVIDASQAWHEKQEGRLGKAGTVRLHLAAPAVAYLEFTSSPD